MSGAAARSGGSPDTSTPEASASDRSPDDDPLTPDDDDDDDDLSHDDARGPAMEMRPPRLSLKRNGSRQPRSPADLPALPGGGGGGGSDWQGSGPGRRVRYEDMTAIDWIHEATKERQRVRVLASSAGSGLLRPVLVLADAGQVWAVLLLTGAAVGALTAAIDLTIDWLADVKLGFCASGPEGGRFYLSKGLCCYGYDQGSHCAGWRPWSDALGVRGPWGGWLAEYLFFVVFSVLFAASAALLVQDYAVHAMHSGIPEVKTILGGFVMRKFLSGWTLVTKSFGLVLAVSSGMWLGKEGPLVHVACCCGNLFTRLFRNIDDNEARKRAVLSAAAASGISVAFGSPIGGVLFSLEQLSYFSYDKNMWQSFVCAMAASVVLQLVDPFRSGKLVLYQTRYSRDWHGFELVPYAVLGVLGGIYGGLFIKLNMAVARWKQARRWLPGPMAQVAAVALLTALINYPNHYMKFQTSELVSNLVAECSQVLDDQVGICKTGAASAGTVVLLVLAAVVGFLLASVTFGLQIPAGILLPSMAIGALVGRATGILMELWVEAARSSSSAASASSASSASAALFLQCQPDEPCVTPGTYAIVGAAAALTGVTRMTVSIVVVMLELTGAITYVLPIMVAVMVSKWVGDGFSRHSIYDAWIRLNHYPFLDASDESLALVPDGPTAPLMTPVEDLVVLTATGHTMASLSAVLDMHPYRGFPVVSDPRSALLLGYISRAELRHMLLHAAAARGLPPDTDVFFAHQPLADPRASLDLRPWMDQTPLTLPARTSFHLAVAYFHKLGLRYMLFTHRGALQGLLTKKDVWYVLEGAAETRRSASSPSSSSSSPSSGVPQHMDPRGLLAPRAALFREDDDAEDRSLLRMDDDAGSIL